MFKLSDELVKKVDKKMGHFSKIIKSCLKAKAQKVLIISDTGSKGHQLSSMLARGYYLAAQKRKLEVEVMFQSVKKGFMHADEHVTSALNELEEGSIIILSVSNKLGRVGLSKSFRKFCVEKKHRFLSSTGLGDASNSHFDIFMEAININYSRMIKKGLVIKKKLDKAKEVRVKTEAGTDLRFNVEGTKAVANVGNYYGDINGGNMPAGEVYIPPKGYYGVNGVLIVDGSMKSIEGAFLLDEPLKLFVEEGRIVKIEGKYAELLERTFQKYEDRAKYPYRVRHVGELGIGINPGAVLIGSTIMDEKVLGTAHIGIGSNYWFGGDIKTIFHGDQIFKNPKIFIDGTKLEV
jgi:leucyl aminopeptidase (aminopeptidase T)